MSDTDPHAAPPRASPTAASPAAASASTASPRAPTAAAAAPSSMPSEPAQLTHANHPLTSDTHLSGAGASAPLGVPSSSSSTSSSSSSAAATSSGGVACASLPAVVIKLLAAGHTRRFRVPADCTLAQLKDEVSELCKIPPHDFLLRHTLGADELIMCDDSDVRVAFALALSDPAAATAGAVTKPVRLSVEIIGRVPSNHARAEMPKRKESMPLPDATPAAAAVPAVPSAADASSIRGRSSSAVSFAQAAIAASASTPALPINTVTSSQTIQTPAVAAPDPASSSAPAQPASSFAQARADSNDAGGNQSAAENRVYAILAHPHAAWTLEYVCEQMSSAEDEALLPLVTERMVCEQMQRIVAKRQQAKTAAASSPNPVTAMPLGASMALNPTPLPPSPTASWVCPACTLHNPRAAPRCEACLAPIPADRQASALAVFESPAPLSPTQLPADAATRKPASPPAMPNSVPSSDSTSAPSVTAPDSSHPNPPLPAESVLRPTIRSLLESSDLSQLTARLVLAHVEREFHLSAETMQANKPRIRAILNEELAIVLPMRQAAVGRTPVASGSSSSMPTTPVAPTSPASPDTVAPAAVAAAASVALVSDHSSTSTPLLAPQNAASHEAQAATEAATPSDFCSSGVPAATPIPFSPAGATSKSSELSDLADGSPARAPAAATVTVLPPSEPSGLPRSGSSVEISQLTEQVARLEQQLAALAVPVSPGCSLTASALNAAPSVSASSTSQIALATAAPAELISAVMGLSQQLEQQRAEQKLYTQKLEAKLEAAMKLLAEKQQQEDAKRAQKLKRERYSSTKRFSGGIAKPPHRSRSGVRTARSSSNGQPLSASAISSRSASPLSSSMPATPQSSSVSSSPTLSHVPPPAVESAATAVPPMALSAAQTPMLTPALQSHSPSHLSSSLDLDAYVKLSCLSEMDLANFHADSSSNAASGDSSEHSSVHLVSGDDAASAHPIALPHSRPILESIASAGELEAVEERSPCSETANSPPQPAAASPPTGLPAIPEADSSSPPATTATPALTDSLVAPSASLSTSVSSTPGSPNAGASASTASSSSSSSSSSGSAASASAVGGAPVDLCASGLRFAGVADESSKESKLRELARLGWTNSGFASLLLDNNNGDMAATIANLEQFYGTTQK